MHDNGQESTALLSRLERLERENKRMKQTGFCVLLLVGSVFVMGQSRSQGRVVEAEKFVVKDSGGKTRGEFGVDAGDATGATLTVGSLSEQSRGDQYLVTLHGGDYAWLNLRSAKSREFINGRLNPGAKEGALFALADGQDYEADIGNADLVSPKTGERYHTSAASVVLIGKDKKVLWSAP